MVVLSRPQETHYLSITSSFSSNTSHEESILLQESFYVSISGSDLQVEIYDVESLVPPFARSEEAIEWIYDILIRRIIQTLLLTIHTKFCDCSTCIYEEKTMFVMGCKVSQNK